MRTLAQWFPFWRTKPLRVVHKSCPGTKSRPELQVLEDRLTPASPGVTSAATVSIAENRTPVLTVTATDADADPLTYSIVGTNSAANIDHDKFMISDSGALSFVNPPNFEVPTDSDANNIYRVVVRVSDGTNSVFQSLSVTVTNVNEASPVITSSAVASVPESTKSVLSVKATDADANTTFVYSIASTFSGDNVDGARFVISGSGALAFAVAPDFEVPTDDNADNDYRVTVRVSDGVNVVSQNVVVTVTNTVESSVAWALKSDEATTGGGTRSRDTQLTYIATYSAPPTRVPTARDFLVTKARIVAITQDGSDPLKYEVVLQPALSSVPITVTSSVKSGWNGSNSLPSTTQTISVFRSTTLTPRAGIGNNPKGIISGTTTTLNDLVFTFPRDFDGSTVDLSAPYVDNFNVVGCTITSVEIVGRTILVDATINSVASPTDSAEVSVKLRDGAILDTYGNPFRESSVLRWSYDTKPPTALLEITSGSGVVGQFVTVSVAFSEVVVNFKPTMIQVTLDGTPVSVLVSGSRAGWSFRFRVAATGTISIGLNTTGVVPGSRVADRAGNELGSANTLTLTGFIA